MFGENLEEFGQIKPQLSFIEQYSECHFHGSLEENMNKVILVGLSHEYRFE